MFTKIVRTFLRRPDSSFKDQHNQAVDQQLRADLATAAGSGMMTTRSRDCASPSYSTDKVVISTSTAKKRRVDENEGIVRDCLSAKRRHISLDLSTDLIQGAPESPTPLDALPKERTIIEDRDRKGDPTDAAEPTRQEEKYVDIVSKSTQLPLGDEPPLALNNKGRNETINSSAIIYGLGSSEYVDAGYTVATSLNDAAKRKPQTGKGKRGSALSSTPEMMAQVDTRDIAIASKDSHVTKVAQHTRFGSEEPGKSRETVKLQTQEELDADMSDLYQVTVEDESENDAPDVITTIAGLLQSHIATTEAAKAVKRQAKASKEKRRKRDTKLKEQAELAKKNRQKQETSTITGSNEEEDDFTGTLNADSEPKSWLKANSRKPLPLLLPDEILAAEPVTPLSTPPLDPIAKPKKRIFIDSNTKHPKDVKHGSVNVRVLETMKPTLPPKNSKASMLLKESWLSGCRGNQNGAGSSRRKMNGGFVVKK
ncbi:hypothetical protein MMC14_002822 [Varicellaria rhodocarpa]|nr:hypothetical protein [Varicellaria rhodocarpa]